MFWTIAAALLFAAAFMTFYPLLRQQSLWKPTALALVFAVPALAAWMYTQVGTPEGIRVTPKPAPERSTVAAPADQSHATNAGEMDAMIAGLQARLEQNPGDVDGWLLLARSYKATQRFPEAAAALQEANQLQPNNPRIMVDLVEAEIFLTSDGRISDENIATLKHVLNLDPGMQKALWLMGIASSQRGDAEAAVVYWESLLAQLEPGSSVALSVQSQIDQLKAQAGMATAEPQAPAEAEPAAADDGSWRGMQVSVRAGDGVQSQIPSGGVLYVMIRTSGPAMGPPLGVKRIIDPALPLEVTISDQDSMMQERPISTESALQLQARISLTGSPAANRGDWQSASIPVSLDSGDPVELVIDQRVE